MDAEEIFPSVDNRVGNKQCISCPHVIQTWLMVKS